MSALVCKIVALYLTIYMGQIASHVLGRRHLFKHLHFPRLDDGDVSTQEYRKDVDEGTVLK